MTPGAEVVCVLGMHRSGTSVTTALVEALGFDVGPGDSLLPPVAWDNAGGYWEQRAILDLNEELLALLDGTWWQPPRLRAGWERDSLLNGILAKARTTLETLYAGRTRWVVKDPRMSILLPFWLRAIAPREPRVVLCIRAPAAVAASLQRRERERRPEDPPAWPSVPTRRACDALWMRHTADALRDSAGLSRTVVAYETLLADPDAVSSKLARGLGLAPVDGVGSALVDAPAQSAIGELPGVLRRSRAERLYARLL